MAVRVMTDAVLTQTRTLAVTTSTQVSRET
jgi:hypothetical protein